VFAKGFRLFKFVAVLDKSMDSSFMMLRNLWARLGYLVILEPTTWVGFYLARRAGVLRGKGRLIMSLDADDPFASRIFRDISLTFMQTRAQVICFRAKTVSLNHMGMETSHRPWESDWRMRGVFNRTKVRTSVKHQTVIWSI
jgi:hypothetical protein